MAELRSFRLGRDELPEIDRDGLRLGASLSPLFLLWSSLSRFAISMLFWRAVIHRDASTGWLALRYHF